MNFRLKIEPETFSTPTRESFIIEEVEAYPVGNGVTTAEGIPQMLFFISFNDTLGVQHSTSNVNIETQVTLPDGTVYPLLSNLFSIDPLVQYEAMSLIASQYGYIPLPFESQIEEIPIETPIVG